MQNFSAEKINSDEPIIKSLISQKIKKNCLKSIYFFLNFDSRLFLINLKYPLLLFLFVINC